MSDNYITLEMLEAAFAKIKDDGPRPYVDVMSLPEYGRRHGKVVAR